MSGLRIPRWCVGALGALVVAGVIGCEDKNKDDGEGGEASQAQGATKEAEEAKPDPKEEHKAVEIATGYYNSAARLANGKVRVWGQAQHGELGNGTSTIGAAPPDPSIDAATPAEAKISGATALVGGHAATGQAGSTFCSIVEGGKVMCWGDEGLIALESSEDRAEPVEVPSLEGATKLAMGLGHACALKGGEVYCWGGNYRGELGIGDKNKRDSSTPVKVKGLSGVTDLAAGDAHSCALIEGGKVMCWGDGSSRQVIPTDQDKHYEPVEVPELTGAKMLGLSDDWSCAVVADDSLTCWGDRDEGLKPKLLEGVEQVSGGSDHICARKGGELYCWGDNDEGQLGTGDTSDKRDPTKIAGLSGVVDVSAGYAHTCAALESGKVMCWGSNEFGELGNNTLNDSTKPVEVLAVAEPELPEPKNGFENVREGDITQKFEGLPEGCEAGKLEGDFKAFFGDAFDIKAAHAERDKKGYIKVVLANYNSRKTPERRFDKKVDARGDQLKAILYFSKVKDPKADDEVDVPADEGTYALQSDDESQRYLAPMSAIHNNHGGFYIRSGLEGGQAELTHIGDDWVCGTLKVKNKHGSFEGPFAAAMPKEDE